MQELFFHEFRSTSLEYYIFLGLTLIGFALGLMFWKDFRKRFDRGGRLASWIILFVGMLMGMFFGYLAIQPEYFKNISANAEGITLRYSLFTSNITLVWEDIDQLELQQDKLVIIDKNGTNYHSPVVYQGDQTQLMQSLQELIIKHNH